MCEEVLGYANLPTANMMLLFESDAMWNASCRVWVAEYGDEDASVLMEIMKNAVYDHFGLDEVEEHDASGLLLFGFNIIDWYEIASVWKYKTMEEQR